MNYVEKAKQAADRVNKICEKNLEKFNYVADKLKTK